VTEVAEVQHIDRGYPNFVADLTGLGVEVERGTAPDEPTFGF
jgi:UDP-N-acetylglucosamine 1-carboxyvinyltransferase